MDKYDYVIAKPEIEEVLYHAGFHKYIDKYLGKNGKWVYVYRKAKNLYERAKQKVKYGTWEDQQRKKAAHQDKVDTVTYSTNYFVRKGQGPLAGGLDDRYYPKSYVTKKLGISSLHGDSRYKKSKKKTNSKTNLRDRGYESAEGELKGTATILTNRKNSKDAIRKVNIYKNNGTQASSRRKKIKPRTKRLKNGAKLTML